MSVKEILTFLDPKNQNLPSLKWGTGFSKVPLIYIPVVQGEEGELKKQFRELRDLHFSGKKESHLEVIKNNRVFRLIGMGKKDQVNARTMRRFFGKYYLNALGGKPKQVAFYCPPEWITVAAVGIHVAALDPGMFKKAWKKTPQPTVALVHPDFKKSNEVKRALHDGEVIAEGKNMVRILGALPPNILKISSPESHPILK